MVEAILQEIFQRKDEFDTPIKTLYFGGGTPSILETQELAQILEAVSLISGIDSNAEITLEANPDDISPKKLKEWKLIGINRLSIGVQSFQDEDLSYLNRNHSAIEALSAVRLTQDIGIDNITIDFIYGIPTLSDEKLLENISIFQSLQIPHLSAYALTVEDNTPLFHLIKRNKIQATDEEQISRQLLLMRSEMEKLGYNAYEISNFAKPNFESKHNSNYWSGNSYIGIGPSAHSFDGKSRRWNISNNARYIQSIKNSEVYFETEKISIKEAFNEYLLTQLRLKSGIDLKVVETKFGKSYTEYLSAQLGKIDTDFYNLVDSKIMLKNQGWLYADGIASDLFWID